MIDRFEREDCEVMSISALRLTQKGTGMHKHKHKHKGCVWKDNRKLYELMKCQKKKNFRSGSFDGKGAVKRKKKKRWWRGNEIQGGNKDEGGTT